MVYVIAEAGSNWCVEGVTCEDLIDVAAKSGADAVKFQVFRANTVYAARAGIPSYLASQGYGDIHEVFRQLELPYERVGELSRYAKERGLDFLATPFSKEDFFAVDPHVEIHKIGSYEINHAELLELVARSGKPLLLATGGATDEEVEWAVRFFREKGGRDLTLMHCRISYPTPPEEEGLLRIPSFAKRYGLPIGLSDHTRHPLVAPIAAVALGATVIEKHFTLDNSFRGPDHNFAVTPEELAELVRAIRLVEKMAQHAECPSEQEMVRFGKRRLQAICDIDEGNRLVVGENVGFLRPGDALPGLEPRFFARLQNRVAARAIPAGKGIEEEDCAHTSASLRS